MVFGFTMPVKVEELVAKAEAIANVLNERAVFGAKVEGKWLESEIRGFKSMVVSHARGEGYSGYLELTYPSCVRLIINTQVVKGVAQFRDIEAYDHPRENPAMDYAELNKAIQEELAK